jgi:Bacteriocin-protection, YdeI or OmpD-Associated/Domain of unknown function (DUF1905)
VVKHVPAATRPEQPLIRCAATLVELATSTLLPLPDEASKQLPSRGQVAVHGAINGHEFQTVVEPDGRGGHWVRFDDPLRAVTGLAVGDTAELVLEVGRDWPEPEVPQDLAAALATAPAEVQNTWTDITPMARWEWVRWVNATKNAATRQRRVEVSISKLDNGKRRPCCFDLSSCTDPDLSKNGELLPTS